MTPQQLKNSILQMAMQGKLVEQRPEEGTGEELYQQIQKEKQKLNKEGKIKRQKPLPEITEDEVPFEIPESWKWVRLNSIVCNHGQKKPDKDFCYIDIGSIDNIHQKLNDNETIVKSENAPSRARKIVKTGDILYSTVRPYLHNMCIVDREFSKQLIASTGFAVMSTYNNVHNKFLFNYLMSPDWDKYANNTQNSKGVAYPAINDDRLYRAVVPLPPLAEQKRIVAKIEEIMPFIDRYAVAYDHLQSYNTRFPDDLKKSILQQAMEGKLSSQWREDNRVDINSWHKMTVADACHEVKVGIVIRPTRYYTDSTGYKAFRSTNVREFHVQNSDWVYINQKGQDENPRTVVHTGDVLIVRSGNTGTACVVPEEYDGCSGIDIIIAVPNKQIIDPEFLCIFTNSPVGKTQINSGTKGMALTHFGAKSYAKLSINVPSLEEQHYIVEQVKRILPKITMLSRVS